MDSAGSWCDVYLLDFASEPLVAQRGAGDGPVVRLPPPPSQTCADARAREVVRRVVDRVPVPPASDYQCPEQALGQGHEQLVPEGDPGNGLPSVCMLNAGEIALLEAEVGQRRELLAARGGSQDRDGDLVVVNVVGQCVEVGVVVEAHRLLHGGCRRRVGIVGGRGVSVDRGSLDGLCELDDGFVGHCARLVVQVDVVSVLGGPWQVVAGRGCW